MSDEITLLNKCERCGRRTGLENGLCIVCVLTDRIDEYQNLLAKMQVKIRLLENDLAKAQEELRMQIDSCMNCNDAEYKNRLIAKYRNALDIIANWEPWHTVGASTPGDMKRLARNALEIE